MTANHIPLSLSDQHQGRARYGINARQQQYATPDSRLDYQSYAEASRTGFMPFGAITPSPADGDVSRKPWRECNRKRGGHDG